MAGTEVLDSSADVRGSARGWHQLQIAVLGFIGLCGVLQRGRPEIPMWLQTLAALLIFAALVIALSAIFVVGRVAWPPAAPPQDAARRLRTGIRLTILAVAMLALGTVSMWWPEDGDGGGGGQVTVQSADGRTWCGQLTAARAGTVGVQTDTGPVVVALADVAALQPVDVCS